jgi:hypothetical protein
MATMLVPFLAIAGIRFAAPPTIYVSPTGSDAGNGTIANPVKTLDEGLNLARSMRSQSPGEATIDLGPGDYPVSSVIRFGAQDSHLTVHGETGARLFAGHGLTDWKPVVDPSILNRLPAQSRDHVLFVDVSSDPVLSQEKPGDDISGIDLVFDHKPMQLARWPKEGTFATTGAVGADQTFQFATDETSKWAPNEDAWAMGYWNADYVEELGRVDLTNPGTVKIQGKLNSGVAANRRFFFLNVLEELDSPGEFYIDRTAHRIYFYPPDDISKHEVFIEQWKLPILGIKDCSQLTLENLIFEGGRNYVGSVDGGDRVVFQKCLIRAFGGSGLTFRQSKNSGVSHCEISGLGAYGISLDAGDRKTLDPGDEFADDNRIFNYARWHRTYQPGVMIAGVHNRASHNEIHDAPHNAILLSGNDHQVEYNDIYRVCTEAGDAGAVYEGRDPSFRGLSIKFNRFRDIKPSYFRIHEFLDVASVYLDDRLGGATVFGNVFEGPGMGVLVGGGRDDLVKNNVFVGKTIAVRVDQRGKTWASGKAEDLYVEKAKEALTWGPIYAQRYPELAAMLNDDPAAAKNDDISLNVCVGATEAFLHLEDGLSPSDVGNTDNVVLSAGNLSDALSAAPAGFMPIPLNQIGPRPSPGAQ